MRKYTIGALAAIILASTTAAVAFIPSALAADDVTFTTSISPGEFTTISCNQGTAAYVGTATYYKKNGSEIGILPLVRDEQQVNIGRFGPAPKKSVTAVVTYTCRRLSLEFEMGALLDPGESAEQYCPEGYSYDLASETIHVEGGGQAFLQIEHLGNGVRVTSAVPPDLVTDDPRILVIVTSWCRLVL